jgi:hypothetical protein
MKLVKPNGRFPFDYGLKGSKMAKAYICEPSARGVGGHYLEYCLRAARALSKTYVSKIVVHAKFETPNLEKKDQSFEIIRHFKTGYFEFPLHNFLKKVKSILLNILGVIQTLSVKKLATTLVLRSSIVARIANHKRWVVRILLLVFLLLIIKVLNSSKEIELVLASILLIGFGYALRAKLRSFLRILKFITINKLHDFYWFWYRTFLSFKVISRSNEIKSLIKRQDININDIVFLTSASYFDVLAIIRLQKKKTANCIFWFVLRRDFDDWGISKHQWRYAGSLVKRHQNVKFFSDTELLQSEYSDLLNLEVKLLPIISSHDGSKPSQKRFLMSYFGDLREEKGFDGFLQLLKNRRFSSEIFFTQAYFSSTLRELNLHFLSEIDQVPNLEIMRRAANRSEYFELLLSTEIVYLNYRTANYKARSSGIFVETIHADSFPFVSQQTWMHKQISELSRSHHRYLWKKGNAQNVGLHKRFKVESDFLLFQLIGQPNQLLEIEARSNSGNVYKLFGWSDFEGVAYVPGPFLRESEISLILSTSRLNSPRSIKMTNCSSLEPRWLGGLVISAENNVSGVLDEYLRLRDVYIQSLKHWSTFKEFHSEEMFHRVLCDSV